MKIVFI